MNAWPTYLAAALTATLLTGCIPILVGGTAVGVGVASGVAVAVAAASIFAFDPPRNAPMPRRISKYTATAEPAMIAIVFSRPFLSAGF